MQKLTIAIIGCGKFANHFVPLFKNHPNTAKVYVCDLIPEKAQEFSEKFGVEIIGSFEEALANPEINCIANYTRRHQHGDISIRALKAGKHVFSAVPMASTVEECQEIVRLVEKTGLTYYIGETCYYFPCAMFCREKYQKGEFGDFAYAAAQYYHHIDAISYGRCAEERGMPPLLYPTHSTSMVLAAVDSYATQVTCYGVKDTSGDPAFTPEGNEWGNEFIDQIVLMRLANGGVARITEARGFGWAKPSSYISGFYGTKAGYEFSNAQHIFVQKDPSCPQRERGILEDVSDYVNPKGMVENKHLPDFKQQVVNCAWQGGGDIAAVQQTEYERIPKEFEGLPNGHMASHQLLVDDFCKAVLSGELPALNAWFAARTNIPGLVAIESAKQGGITLPVPDCGNPPLKK